ncbi:VanZ family protein [Micromonospora sp. DT81.3]|uniref:VanZ family protein n=1 Tax=Actinomycetes TaxID=1760 RepID=UPI003CF1B92B
MTHLHTTRAGLQTRRAVSAGLLLAYGALLAVVALYPTPVDRPVSGLLQGLDEWMRGSYDVLEFTSNVALFVPVGVLVALQLPPRLRWAAVPIGAAVSLGIELLQAALLPERVATPSDVFANTIGTAVGVLLVAVVSRSRQRRRRPSR